MHAADSLNTLAAKNRRRCAARCALWLALLALLAALLNRGTLRADDPLPLAEERAMKAAVARVAPSVVRIETVGGAELLGKLIVGTGPTTGIIVSADGYIVSSAFNFAQKPDSILVNLPGGSRAPAKLVATDHSRKLVLLKVVTDQELPVPEATPAAEMRVGQWSIAVGRTFDGGDRNVSIGIISALGRIWSKAIQTDAKISPSNYGGPLVDIRGRVLGVLVPLTPDAQAEVAGVDWYDSGIGFAVPLEHVFKVLPRLKEGHDLKAGILGISLAPGDQFSLPALIGACRTNSPAYKSGLRTGDKIVELDGHAVARQTELKHLLNPHYSGDTVHVVALRGSERIERDVELTDKLDPYEFPFLGVLPLRPTEEKPTEFHIRYVYPGGPADKAGLKPGDQIAKAAGKAIKNAAELAEQVLAVAPGDTLKLEVRRGEEKLDVEPALAKLPEEVPGELPAAHGEVKAGDDKEKLPATGAIEVKLPEFKNECPAYVPDGYRPELTYGVVVWLHGPGGFKQDELFALWKSHCDEHDLILLAPKSIDPNQWQPTEAAFVRRAIADLSKKYHLDKSRIVIHGHQGGGAVAWVVAFGNPDLVRGVAVVDAPLPAVAQPPDSDPLHPLAVYVAYAEKATDAAEIQTAIDRLRALKHPVTVQDVGSQPRYLTAEELDGLVRWIDALDRI